MTSWATCVIAAGISSSSSLAVIGWRATTWDVNAWLPIVDASSRIGEPAAGAALCSATVRPGSVVSCSWSRSRIG